ncbi:MAG: hypothetical protein Q8K40_01795, partial [Ignavibacteria bacterium]|nr:hypothetical protein [Ignavibacteria bacterium]
MIIQILRDFIGYCKNEFLGETDMVDAGLIKDFALKDAENVELALVIGQQMIAIKEELLKKFVTDLEARFKEALPDWEFNLHKDFSYWSSKWKRIKFCKPGWKNDSLAIEFNANQCAELCWGICKEDEKIPDLPEDTLKKLNDTLKNSGLFDSPQWWPWYCGFSEPYYDWWKNIEPWVAIQSGEMAKIVVDKIVELAKASEAIIDEAERKIQLINATPSKLSVLQHFHISLMTQ